jgi:hypothetical protein
MTENKARKTAARQRMAHTGEPYSVARRAVQDQEQDPEPADGATGQAATGGAGQVFVRYHLGRTFELAVDEDAWAAADNDARARLIADCELSPGPETTLRELIAQDLAADGARAYPAMTAGERDERSAETPAAATEERGVTGERAVTEADEARDAADQARRAADRAQQRADQAGDAAERAQERADRAQERADGAWELVDEQDGADAAQRRADREQERADREQEKAEAAQERADELQEQADEARELADEASELADEVGKWSGEEEPAWPGRAFHRGRTRHRRRPHVPPAPPMPPPPPGPPPPPPRRW